MTDWRAFMQTEGAQFSDGAVTDFGQPQQERKAAEEENILCDLNHYALLRISGDDAQNFLQGQLTNDLRQLESGQSQLSAYCSPKGRIQVNFRIIRDGDDYLILLPRELTKETVAKLKKYVLMSKVVIEDISEELVRIGIAGSTVETILAGQGVSVPENDDEAAIADGVILVRVSGAIPRFIALGDATALQLLWQNLKPSCRPVGSGVWSWLDIQAGIPAVVPQTVEAFVPQMVNLQLVGGVSFKKGCYPGQEVVARMQYLGKLKRRMYLAHVETDECPAPGSELHSPSSASGQGAGKVVDAQPSPQGGCDLLAVVEIAAVEADEVKLGEAGPKLQFQDLPYPFEQEADQAAGQ